MVFVQLKQNWLHQITSHYQSDPVINRFNSCNRPKSSEWSHFVTCIKCLVPDSGSQKSTSSNKSSYGSTESDYYYAVPQYGDLGTPTKPKPLDIIKEYDTAQSDWSSDTGSGPGYEVIKLERVRNIELCPSREN